MLVILRCVLSFVFDIPYTDLEKLFVLNLCRQPASSNFFMKGGQLGREVCKDGMHCK